MVPRLAEPTSTTRGAQSALRRTVLALWSEKRNSREPTASEWWQDKELYEVLATLPGAGVVLEDGQLTVVFVDLDADSIRTALGVPSLIRRGVRQVTLH